MFQTTPPTPLAEAPQGGLFWALDGTAGKCKSGHGSATVGLHSLVAGVSADFERPVSRPPSSSEVKICLQSTILPKTELCKRCAVQLSMPPMRTRLGKLTDVSFTRWRSVRQEH